MRLHLDRESTEPLYLQIASQIKKSICTGELAPGAKLPPERTLCRDYALSPGTVRAAYQILLRNGLLTAVRGSGHFVALRLPACTLAEAQPQISSLFDELTALPDLTVRELFAMCTARQRAYARVFAPVRIAWIDCSPEVLHSTERQLKAIPHVHIDSFVTGEFIKHGKSLAAQYDFAITTPHHVQEISPVLAGSRCQLEKLDFTVSHETTVNMLRIPAGRTVAVLYQIERFFNYVKLRLQEFERVLTFLPCQYEDADRVIARFRPSDLTLVIPGDYPNGVPAKTVRAIDAFVQGGGETIYFYPTVDQGSLLFLNEKIRTFDQHRRATQKEALQ